MTTIAAQTMTLIDGAICRIDEAIASWSVEAPRPIRQAVLDIICEDVTFLSEVRASLDADQQWFERYARDWWYRRYCTSYYR